MLKNLSKHVLQSMAILIASLIAIVFVFSHYCELRIEGVGATDAALTSAFISLCLLLILIIIAAVFINIILPECSCIFHGLLLMRHKSQEQKLNAQEESMAETIVTECIQYSTGSFLRVLSEEELEILVGNIENLYLGKPVYKPIYNENLNQLTSLDLFHFAWNIGKRILRLRNGLIGPEMADFLKKTFPKRLKSVDMQTIRSKLTSEDGKFSVGLIKPEEPLSPHAFPNFPLA
ncbi:MAG: hypothetical protein LIP09_08700 [Bacteroidales bacterium]|nr:hypothetical protein [Bacteroidales bacterium]